MAQAVPPDLTPEQFAQLVKGATDEQILETVRQGGTKEVLDRVFQGMQEAFDPGKAQNVDAEIQWVVTDQGEEFPYIAKVSGGNCRIESGRSESPRVGLTTDLVSFLRLIVGQAQGTQLFFSGKLKVTGDLMFSQQVAGFFRPPG
jgi:predicted lipid carrier protein YhbT